MSLRKDDERAIGSYLAKLEAGPTKALQAPVFSAYGGLGYGNAGGGHYGSQAWMPWQPGAKYDYRTAAGDLWRNSAVACCLAWYADNFPEPQMRVMRTVGFNKRTGQVEEEVVPDHALVRTLQNPNPFQSWHSIAKGLCLSYRTDGNGFLLAARPIAHMVGEPIQLWWLPHDRIWPRWDTTGNEFITWWDYQVDARIIRLELDQVIHFQDGIDPYNDRLGLSALKSCYREVCTDNSGAGFTASIMRNMGVIGYAISPLQPEDTFGDKEERDEIADSFQERFAGEGRGRPLVNSRGIKVDKIGMTPEELALDKLMNIPESRICSAMRINAMVVGLNVGATQKTFNNYEESRKAAYEDGIVPMQGEFSRVINHRLLPLLGDPRTERFEFFYENIACMQESQDKRFRRYGDAYQKDKLLTLNEARKALGQEATKGGDKFADGSTPEEGPTVPPAPIAPGAEADPDELAGQSDDDDEAEAVKTLVADSRELLALARQAYPVKVAS
jgi:HK97 family phage portal protein